MQMALDHGHRSVEYMAIKCGVSRSTISRWINDGGKRPPRRGDMEIWARECRVPIEWLAPTGDDEPIVQVTLPYIATKLATSTSQPDKSAPRRGHLRPVRAR